jgi:hypothetical protein
MIAHLQVIIRWRSLVTSMSALTVLAIEDSTQMMSMVTTDHLAPAKTKNSLYPWSLGTDETHTTRRIEANDEQRKQTEDIGLSIDHVPLIALHDVRQHRSQRTPTQQGDEMFAQPPNHDPSHHDQSVPAVLVTQIRTASLT